MSAIRKTSSHKHDLRGDADMEEVPSKEFKIGNTTVIIHSPLVLMSVDEKSEWFRTEWEKGNPVLKRIAEAVHDCYRD
jgi:hypothetical protein